MAKRPTLTNVTSAYGSQGVLNTNNDEILEAFDNTLSRDGSTPNQMEADLDMNSNDILNVKDLSMSGTLTIDGVEISQDNAAAAAASAAEAAASALAAEGAVSAPHEQSWNVVSESGDTTFDLDFDPVNGDRIRITITRYGESRDLFFTNGDFTLVSSATAPSGKAVQLTEVVYSPAIVNAWYLQPTLINLTSSNIFYNTEAEFENAITTGLGVSDGTRVVAGGREYYAASGANILPDKPGFLPLPSRVKIVLIDGQSNAASTATEASQNSPDLSTNKNVRYWDGSTLVTMDPANAIGVPVAGNNNVGFQMGKRGLEKEADLVIVLASGDAGEPISSWTGSGVSSTAYAATASYVSSFFASPFATQINRTSIDSIVWLQGESDGGPGYVRSTYETSFNTLKSQWRAESWFDEDTPIIVPGLAGNNGPGISASFVTNDFHYGVLPNDGDPHTFVINTTGLVAPDDTHWDGPSLTTIGKKAWDITQSRTSTDSGGSPNTVYASTGFHVITDAVSGSGLVVGGWDSINQRFQLGVGTYNTSPNFSISFPKIEFDIAGQVIRTRGQFETFHGLTLSNAGIASFEDSTQGINTDYKFDYVLEYESNNDRLMVSTGPNATDSWRGYAHSVTVTPDAAATHNWGTWQVGSILRHRLNNSANEDINSGYTEVTFTDNTDGSEDSQYDLRLLEAGALVRQFRAEGGSFSLGSLTPITATRGSLNTTGVFVNGTQVVGSQQAAIADVPTGGSATAADNAAAINSILAALRAHGIIAT